MIKLKLKEEKQLKMVRHKLAMWRGWLRSQQAKG